MLVAYIDHKKVLDSLRREALWDLLRLCRIPARGTGLFTGLYSGTASPVKGVCEGVAWPAFFREYGSEAGRSSCYIAFRDVYGTDTRQSCGPRSL